MERAAVTSQLDKKIVGMTYLLTEGGASCSGSAPARPDALSAVGVGTLPAPQVGGCFLLAPVRWSGLARLWRRSRHPLIIWREDYGSMSQSYEETFRAPPPLGSVVKYLLQSHLGVSGCQLCETQEEERGDRLLMVDAGSDE